MTPEHETKISQVMKQGLKAPSTSVIHDKTCQPTSKLSVEWSSARITHLQPSRVADLWRKAEEILSTPDFIVTAAGNPSARQVASVSGATSSKGVIPPPFVYSKKSGTGVEVHCDCPVFRSTPKVCQHSLAAAEHMGITSQYLAWVRKTKSVGLNLSNLISKELPKSTGQKGSTSRSKGVPKGKKQPILAEKDGIVCSNISHAPTLSSPTSLPTQSFAPMPMLTQAPPRLALFYSPLPSPSGLSSMNYYDQPTFNSPYFNCYYSPQCVQTPSSQQVFGLKRLEGTRIRSCYGCGNPIRMDLASVPPPPNDVVVSYKERRYYKDPSSHEMRVTQKEENTYYHVMQRCISLKHPEFHASMLKIPDSILSSLQEIHHLHIMEQFGIQI